MSNFNEDNTRERSLVNENMVNADDYEFRGSVNSGEDEAVSKGHKKYFPLLIFTLFFYIGTMGAYILIPQYVLSRLKQEANLTKVNSSSPCTVNKSDPDYAREQEIQAESSRILGAITFSSGIPCILTVFIFGAISDRYGRKLVIMMNFVGLLLSNLMMTLIVNMNLSIYIYIVFAFFNGVTGSYSALLASVFAYTADVTTKEQRNVALGVMHGSLGLAMVITSLAVGYWIEFGGFGAPIIGLTVLTGVSGCFFVCVKETRHRSGTTDASAGVCRSLLSAVRTQFNDIKRLLVWRKRRSVCLLILAVSFFCHAFIFIGTLLITTLYLMNQPFCWDYATFGIFSAVKSTVWYVGSFTMIVVFRNRVSDVTLIMIGFLSFLVTFALFGVASLFPPPVCNVLVIVGVATGFAISICPTLIRSATSKLVSVDEQGAAFGLIATGEAMAIAFGPAVLSAVYGASVAFLKGFTFFFGAVFACTALLLMTVYRVISRPLSQYVEMTAESN